METTDQKKRTVSSDAVAKTLEANGWLRSVAGDHDFDLAVKGVTIMVNERKGLLLVGEAGVGKTALLKTLFKVYSSMHPYWLSCVNEHDLYKMQYIDDGVYLNKLMFIDDAGTEQEQMINYQKVDCFSKFVQWYHDEGESHRLFISTNLNAEQINTKYGGRVLDRLLEMCVVVKFSGKSKRERNIVK